MAQQHITSAANAKATRRPLTLYDGPCPFLTELARLVEEITDPEYRKALVVLARFLAAKQA